MRSVINKSGFQVVLFSVAAMTALILCGCGSKNSPDMSLLGDSYDVPSTGKSLRLPKSFVPLADSELIAAKEYVRQQLGDNLGMSLQQIYHADSSQSTIWIYSINDLNTSTDTAAFINYYRQGLLTAFGDSNVKMDNYKVGDILVKEFIVKAVEYAYMKMYLICISNSDNGLILEYNTPITNYDSYKKAFESSIASLKIKGQ